MTVGCKSNGMYPLASPGDCLRLVLPLREAQRPAPVCSRSALKAKSRASDETTGEPYMADASYGAEDLNAILPITQWGEQAQALIAFSGSQFADQCLGPFEVAVPHARPSLPNISGGSVPVGLTSRSRSVTFRRYLSDDSDARKYMIACAPAFAHEFF